jgi:hypothetical protein
VATSKCGTNNVTYDEKQCTYTCYCQPGGCYGTQSCSWAVSCPDGKGGWTTVSGTGRVEGNLSDPKVTVAGTLEGLAINLSKMWGRRISAAKVGRTKKRIKRTLSGSKEEIARALSVSN